MINELPERITSLMVPQLIVDTSRDLLEPFRQMRIEGCLLWYGKALRNGECLVTRCIRPDQENFSSSYAIASDSMRAVRRAVRGDGLLLLTQIHSHPRRAFFSHWDELNALNKSQGALNLVIPDYGNVAWIDTKRFCMVEMDSHGAWQEWRGAQWQRLVVTEGGMRT